MSENPAPKKQKLKIEKQHIQGFIAGVLLVCIVFGTVLIVNNDPAFFSGTIESIIYEHNFEEEVIKESRYVLVYVHVQGSLGNERAMWDFINEIADESGKYIKTGYCSLSKDGPIAEKYGINNTSLVLFRHGEIVASDNASQSKLEFRRWLGSLHINFAEDEEKAAYENAPKSYYMFPEELVADRDPSQIDVNVTGELLLLPYDYNITGFLKCDGSFRPIQAYNKLYSLLGSTFGGDGDTQYKLPDMTDKSPINGINYYLCSDGDNPSGNDAPFTNSGGVKYTCHLQEFGNCFIGEIKLLKNIDETRYDSLMIPCDGRELRISSYPALYSLIATKFGGDGRTTFKIPDMTNVASPVDGAVFYIILDGLFPY
ncbi:MAG: tail fiber protein [Eubacteriales bacterium]|nr:tail fiber protein [Eubacteriales bacterium]